MSQKSEASCNESLVRHKGNHKSVVSDFVEMANSISSDLELVIT